MSPRKEFASGLIDHFTLPEQDPNFGQFSFMLMGRSTDRFKGVVDVAGAKEVLKGDVEESHQHCECGKSGRLLRFAILYRREIRSRWLD